MKSTLSKATLVCASILASVVLGGAFASRAAEMEDDDYIAARISHYREIGASMKAIMDELKKPQPNAAVIRTNAAHINGMAKQQYGWFRAGSGPESEVKTKAKPVIWQKPADFKAAQDNFLAASGKLLDAANSGAAPAALTPQVKALGQACSTCHQTFRED